MPIYLLLADVVLPGWAVGMFGVASIPALGAIVWLAMWIGRQDGKSAATAAAPASAKDDLSAMLTRHINEESKDIREIKVTQARQATDIQVVLTEQRGFGKRLDDHFALHHGPKVK